MERQEYIRFDKNTGNYSWALRKVATNHRHVEDLIKEKNLWENVKSYILTTKTKNHTRNQELFIIKLLKQFIVETSNKK